MRSLTVVLALAALAASPARGVAQARNVLVTGYWPPTNEMLRPWSTDPALNPGGWIGADWEGRGYDVHAFFPECAPVPNPGRCSGDLEVDYQDTSPDWWRIADSIQPVAIVTFSRGSPGVSWEVEMNQYNRSAWVDDYTPPRQPTPAPPDASIGVDALRPSTLPVDDIVAAVAAAGLGVTPFVDRAGDGGAFLSEFVAYHGVWYQDLHSAECDAARCVTAGHVHVGIDVPVPTARAAVEETLRVVIAHVDAILAAPWACTDPACVLEPACADQDFDGDGVRNADDCAPLDPGAWSVPPDIAHLAVAGGSSALLSWSDVTAAAGPALRHDVVTGRVEELRVDRDFGRASCLADDEPARSLGDPRPPGAGSAFYYLVRAQNACASGSSGRAAADATCP